MTLDHLAQSLFDEIRTLPIFDPHSHIDPFQPVAKSLEDLLGYHYYTELAHSAGLKRKHLRPEIDSRERCQAIFCYLDRFDNTAQYSWLLEIAQTFLGFDGDRLASTDCNRLFDSAAQAMARPDWEQRVVAATNLERIFLTNAFDDRLDGFDRERYVPCLRVDDLVFNLHSPDVRLRLEESTGQKIDSTAALRAAIFALFVKFREAGFRACAVSLPPDFCTSAAAGDTGDAPWDREFAEFAGGGKMSKPLSCKVLWMLAEACREFRVPFDLMIGVNRKVYRDGVYQGQDLFDQRTSLIQYADLFNAFPKVTFCVSVLSSGQNQELVSYSWIFPNVLPHGHWWYSNIPAYIETDLRARLGAVPKFKLLGYYSDAYKLEFVLPKFNMYRRLLAKVLADDFVRPGRITDTQAVDWAKQLLRDNPMRVFKYVQPPNPFWMLE